MGEDRRPPEPIDLSARIDFDALAGSMARHPAGKGIGPAETLPIHEAHDVMATWSPSGLTVAFTSSGYRRCYRFDAAGMQALRDALGGTR